MVHRLVQLAVRCVDAQGTEQRVHAEGACFVGHDGNDALADAFCPGQVTQEAHEGHRGADGLLAATFVELCVGVGRWQGHVKRRGAPLGEEAIESLTSLEHVRDLCRAFLGHDVRQVFQVFVGEVQADGVPHVVQSGIVGLLLPVRGVAAGEGRAQSVALDGAGEDDRGLSLVRHGSAVRGMDAHGVVATDVVGQRFEVRVAHVGDQRRKLWRVEQLGPNHVTRRGHQPLLVAVGEGREAGRQSTGAVRRKERVP